MLNDFGNVLEQYGMKPDTVKDWLHVDPSNYEDLRKIGTNMVGEMAKDSMGPGQRIAVAEYTNQMKGTPNPDILPRTAKFIIDNLIVPKADWEAGRFDAIVNEDPRSANLRSKLVDYEKNNPLDKIISDKINANYAAPPGAPAGTKRYNDGHLYAPDPNRAGKYLKVE
jgi:hypothetical protein